MSRAKFFDGLSSQPNEVIYDYDIVNHFILFSHNQINYTWEIANCHLEYSNHQLSISPKNEAGQLFITDSADISAIKHSTKNNSIQFYYQKLVDAGIGVHALIMGAILGLILLANFYIIPAIAEKAVTILPTSYDYMLGESFYDEYLEYEDIDSARTQLAQEFIEEMNFNSDYNYNVTVVESEMVNAFALPNGAIIVYSGLLDRLENYEEFAALLGHEAAHINLRHSMKMLCRNLSTYVFISAIFSDVNGIITVLVDNVHQLQSLTYSRSLEEEADYLSGQTLVFNQIDPVGLKHLFEKLTADSNSYIPEFLRTHPITEKRIEKAEEYIRQNDYLYKKNNRMAIIFESIKSTKP